MGAVFLAIRTDGKFEQKVALKLLKREMNTANLRRRFEQERTILASLEHPNIARLLDAGTTDDGIPFLVMEYVEGVPIDDFCNVNNFDLSQRLDLFRKICAAVGFAHRNLIVHRDLKPSNVLVTKDGSPKLLDFGISKILSNDFEQISSATVTKLGMMTPSYASPEQLQNKSVTTATDIYSLGVILYELLSGHRPFESKEDDIKEIYKAVLENETPPPSALIETVFKQHQKPISGENSFDSKSKNQTAFSQTENKTRSNKSQNTIRKTVNVNPQSLRGDLDNIVLKALRKEPERRYSSAEIFADDIHLHQRGLPVSARSNTFAYRAEKFIKRNKAGAIAGFFVFLAIICGIAATLWQARIACAERDRAQLEAEKVKKINAYTQNILNFSNPNWLSSNPQQNRDAKISDALDEALKNTDTDLANQPEIQAEVLFTIGITFVSQGQYEKSEKLLQQSIEKFDQSLGGENLKSMQASVVRADALYHTGKFDEAEKLYIQAINYFQPKISEDKSHIKWLAIAINDRANIYVSNTRLAEAEEMYHQSLKLTESMEGKDRFMVPVVLVNLGNVNLYSGNYNGAKKFFEQAFDEFRLTGKESTFEAGSLHTLIGIMYMEIGDYEQADVNYQKSYDILNKTVGEENFYTLTLLYRQAQNYYKQNKFVEAERLNDRAFKVINKVFPAGHQLTAAIERLQGEIFTKTGELQKGEIILRKVLGFFETKTKSPNRHISLVNLSLGENLIAQKRFSEAEKFINTAIENASKSLGENHPFTKQCREMLEKIPK